jgi:putative acetyltransferase
MPSKATTSITAAGRFVIRREAPQDAAAITAVTVAAFRPLPISRQTEHFIVEALRAAGALAVSLVAELNGRVIGHIAFSRATISDGSRDWYALGPVSVLPEFQRQGVGSALVREGLSQLKPLGAQGCCLVGHPSYYGRFGFQNTPGLGVEGVSGRAFFAMSFSGAMPQGFVGFHPAFGADGTSHS